jgi:iron-sulfur cluster repair protein YtfE (RIC family)
LPREGSAENAIWASDQPGGVQMTAEHRVTAPLRSEHEQLRPHVQELDAAAEQVDAWDRARATRVLGEILAFLRGHLVPHAGVEERVLYPAVERAMGAPGATATMVADHGEIVRRIDRLAELAANVEERWPDAELARALRSDLIGLSAILELHFAKEEDVLLPVLDATLTAEDAERLFDEMGHTDGAAHHH